jgi:predicted RNase H-like nuclease
VLGVDGCAGGWVGALLAPDLPRPQVYAAPTIAELVETALQSWSVSVVAINAPADSTPETRAQVDAWRQTRPRCTVVETHPELSFAEMAGGPMAAAKTTPEGIAAHLAELARHGISRPSVLADSGYAADDLLDACAAAWTAARYVSGDARSLPDPPEVSSDGIPAAIWV